MSFVVCVMRLALVLGNEGHMVKKSDNIFKTSNRKRITPNINDVQVIKLIRISI